MCTHNIYIHICCTCHIHIMYTHEKIYIRIHIFNYCKSLLHRYLYRILYKVSIPLVYYYFRQRFTGVIADKITKNVGTLLERNYLTRFNQVMREF